MITEFGPAFEHVAGSTRPSEMTDGEIRREMKMATGPRREELEREVEDRKVIRSSPDVYYPTQ